MKLWRWTTVALSLLIAGIGLYYALFVYADEAERFAHIPIAQRGDQDPIARVGQVVVLRREVREMAQHVEVFRREEDLSYDDAVRDIIVELMDYASQYDVAKREGLEATEADVQAYADYWGDTCRQSPTSCREMEQLYGLSIQEYLEWKAYDIRLTRAVAKLRAKYLDPVRDDAQAFTEARRGLYLGTRASAEIEWLDSGLKAVYESALRDPELSNYFERQ